MLPWGGGTEHPPTPISLASSPAPPEPVSGRRDQPTLMEEFLACQYIEVEDSPAPQDMVVEESPVPMSGAKNRPCLVVEPPLEPTYSGAYGWHK